MSQWTNSLDLSNLDSWDTSRIRDTMFHLECEKSDIEFQTDAAKRKARAEGQYADHEWLTKAEYAARKKGLQIRALQTALGRRRELEKEQSLHRLERLFIDQARRLLSEAEFGKIMDAAINAAIGAEHQKVTEHG